MHSAPTLNPPACANCGQLQGGIMGSTAWGHNHLCCSSACGRRLGRRIANGMAPRLPVPVQPYAGGWFGSLDATGEPDPRRIRIKQLEQRVRRLQRRDRIRRAEDRQMQRRRLEDLERFAQGGAVRIGMDEWPRRKRFLLNRTLSIGRAYACFARQAAGSPLADRANTKEVEGLQRRGDGYLIRLPFTGQRPTTGLVLGWWRKTSVEPGEGGRMEPPDRHPTGTPDGEAGAEECGP